MGLHQPPDFSEIFPELLVRGFQEQIVVLNRQLQVVHANERFLGDHGLTLQDVLEAPCYSILLSCSTICRTFAEECPVHEAMFLDCPTSITQRDVPIGAGLCHFKIHIHPVRLHQSQQEYFLHITRDITARIEQERLRENMWMEVLKRMENLYEEMIQEGEEVALLRKRLKHLMDVSPLAIVGWDQEGRIKQWNSNAELLFGWTEAEVLGKPFKTLFASGPSQERMDQVIEAINRGQELDYSVAENRTASWDLLTCEWHHSSHLFAEKNTPSGGGLSLGQDISENIKAIQSLQQAEEDLDVLLQAVDSGLVGVNHLGRITFWNRFAEELFGWSKEEIRGREVEILLPPEGRKLQGREISRFFSKDPGRAGKVMDMELTACHRNQNQFPVRFKLFIASFEQRRQGIIEVTDLRAQKQLEQVLGHSEKMRTLGEMAGGMAHDLNNSLSVILGYLRLLQYDPEKAVRHDYLDRIEQAAQRGVEKTSELQNLTLGGEKRRESESAWHDISTLISEVVDFTRYRWKDQMEREGHTIEVVTDIEEMPQVWLNASDFREMLVNLVLNSIEALPRGGRLQVSAGAKGDELVMKISDNGIGMSPGVKEHAFEPFYTNKGSSHAGLGLNITQKIITRLHGKITVASVKGAGTTISVCLPLFGTRETGGLSGSGKDRRLSILLIEDDDSLRALLKEVLERAGHSIRVAGNGREGMALFRQIECDLVITDHGMPDMNGEEVAFRIKKHKPDMPVIMVTGWNRELNLLQTKPGLIDELLGKPVDTDALLQAISDLTRGEESSRGPW